METINKITTSKQFLIVLIILFGAYLDIFFLILFVMWTCLKGWNWPMFFISFIKNISIKKLNWPFDTGNDYLLNFVNIKGMILLRKLKFRFYNPNLIQKDVSYG